MWLSLKAENPEKLWEEVQKIKDRLESNHDGSILKYKTTNGEYGFSLGIKTDEKDPMRVYVTFEGKRTSFGMSPFIKIRREKSLFGKDKLKLYLNGKSHLLKVSYFRTSANDKPFWATCSKSDYRALQKLKAR